MNASYPIPISRARADMTTIFGLIYLTAFLATIELAGIAQALITYGPLGLICAYLIYRQEKQEQARVAHDQLWAGKFDTMIEEMRKVSHRLSGLSKGLLMDIMERTHDAHTRQLAKDLLEKVESGKAHE